MCDLAKMMVAKGFEYIGEDEKHIEVSKMGSTGKIISVIPKEMSEGRKRELGKALLETGLCTLK